MEEIKWRFPGNNYTDDAGLDTADMETFKKDAISSLARELCQNSIDAKRKGVEKPVRIEFKPFQISKDKIPGRDDILSQIIACQETWKTKKKISDQLAEMNYQIQKDEIMCLRISDFNTTGLIGVSGGEHTPWHYLVHGSGISDKGATSGGSKGIGKFATFVNSHFNTVFYSTNTEKGEKGFEGICKLCSAKQPNTDEKTRGIGYYGSSLKNEPIVNKELMLDPCFVRQSDEFGSDIYILGFKNQTGWKRDIISKILDSFMSAIIYNSLEVVVDDIEITSGTLEAIVYNDELINKIIKKSIISQFLLLADETNRYEDVITIDGYGTAKLFLLEFDKENEDLSTNGCVMIRYPYMKIKDINKISTLPCSAMCIIEDNDLNAVLRNVENPQHTNWEFNRIEDESQRSEIKGIYNELLDQIKNIIMEHLASSDNTKTDIEGAGDYIQGQVEEFGNDGTPKPKIVDQVSIQQKVRPKKANINASVEDKNGDGIELDIGEATPEGEVETLAPEGRNKGGGGQVRPGENPSTGRIGDDGNIIVKHSELRGMSYRFFCINKKAKKYGVVFTSDFEEKDVTFQLFALDESGFKYKVMLEECKINGVDFKIENDALVKFSLKHGQKYKIEIVTDQTELFSGEVKLYAYR